MAVRAKRLWTVGVAVTGAAVVAAVLAPWLVPQVRPEAVLGAYRPGGHYAPLEVVYPLDECLFPPEIVAPTFRWRDKVSGADCWAGAIAFEDDGAPIVFCSYEPCWRPSDQLWAAMRRRSRARPATATLVGVRRRDPSRVLSAGRVTFGTSTDPVDAPLFYREVNLPFKDAVKDPSRIRWRFGAISSKHPPVVLERLPVCANCHSFSADGTVLGMDVDYANDKGSYAIVPVERRMVLTPARIITWSDFRPQDGQRTFGLLSQVSPDGRHVISTVKDRSVFVPRPGLEYSQLFFPIMGVLAVYSRDSGAIEALPGADDPAFVQSNPAWRPDGRTIVFTRARAHQLEKVGDHVLLTAQECREFLELGKTFLFDLYRIPFNGGKGGRAEPVPGASRNGVSNYFPKFSPDGQWLVFCQARSYSLLQPDSRLHIMPAAGGAARAMRCNLPNMNSWHSWSPNGRWLVFSSKANGPYTQLWLAHVDAQGRSRPPVVLDHLTAPDRAANIPEFVNASPEAIAGIRERFLDDHSFVRAGREFLRARDFGNAERQLRKALAANPRNALARTHLAACLRDTDRTAEAVEHLRQAISHQPDFGHAYALLGEIRLEQRANQEADALLTRAIRLDPTHARAHRSLGQLRLMTGAIDAAVEHFSKAARLAPDHPDVLGELAGVLLATGRTAEAVAYARRFCAAATPAPTHVNGLVRIALFLASDASADRRDGQAAVELASKACELTSHRQVEALDVLAAAYAEVGRFDDAVQAAAKAQAMARASGRAPMARAIGARLSLYRQRRPLRRAWRAR